MVGLTGKPKKKHVNAIVVDLDDTLFDWVGMWYKSFNAMVESLVAESGIDRETLLTEIKAIHERHGTSEYAFVIEELPSLRLRFPQQNLVKKFSKAIDTYRKARHKNLKLRDSVLETLCLLRAKGCLIVGFTESMAFYTVYRVRTLDLDGILDYLYSPEDHDIPQGLTREEIRKYPPEHYALKKTMHMHTAKGVQKPNPDVLCNIMEELGASPAQTVYVGDKLVKDVSMAQAAGVINIYTQSMAMPKTGRNTNFYAGLLTGLMHL